MRNPISVASLPALLSLTALTPAHAQSTPDLRPTTTSAAALSFDPYTCNLRVGVSNAGLAAAPPSRVRLGNQVAPDGSVISVETKVASIPAASLGLGGYGAGFTLSNKISDAKFFSNTPFVPFRVTVDSSNQVNEATLGGESNNQKNFSYHVAQVQSQMENGIPQSCVIRPDLQTTQLEWNKDDCSLNLKVQNKGLVETAPASLPQEFFVSIAGLRDQATGSPSWVRKITHLKRGETYSETITGFRADIDFPKTRAHADSTAYLTESEEVKNVLEVTPPTECLYQPTQTCDFYLTSYDPSTGRNMIEKMRHTLGTNDFQLIQYWDQLTANTSPQAFILDLALVPQDNSNPTSGGTDDVRATVPGRHEKIRFLSGNQFDFDPAFSTALPTGLFSVKQDSGHIWTPPHAPSAEPLWVLSAFREMRRSPLSNVVNVQAFSPMPTSLTQPLASDVHSKYDGPEDVTSIQKDLYASFLIFDKKESLLIKITDDVPQLIGTLKTADGTKVRITGLGAVGNQLYGLSYQRALYRVNAQTATVEFLEQLPPISVGNGTAYNPGYGYGMTVKCDSTALNP